MKHILIGLIATMGLVSAASAVAVTSSANFPSKSGIWSTQKDEGIAWGTRNNAITVVIVGDSVNCGKCKSFDSRTLGSAVWKTFAAANNLALVYWDRSTIKNDSIWLPYAKANTVGGAFPTVNIYTPGGARRVQFLARDKMSQPDYLISVLTPLVAQYPGRQPAGTIGFTTSALTVKEDAGSVAISVARTAGSYGAQSFNVTATAGTYNSAVAGSHPVSWASGDSASKTVNITLNDDGVYTSPTSRTFTVSLSKVSGEATLGTSSMTVTVMESVPYAPGEIGFSSDRLVISEANLVPQAFVERVNGSVGTVRVDYTIFTNGAVNTTGWLEWTNMDSAPKPIDLAGLFVSTPGFDRINTDVTIELSNPEGNPLPTLGTVAQTIEFRDEAISATLPEYTLDDDVVFSSADAAAWFYNDMADAVVAAPLADGQQGETLTFTAPGYGFLTVEFGGSMNGAGMLTLTNSVSGATIPAVDDALESAVLALNAGDTISWEAAPSADDYSPQVKIIDWVPVDEPSDPTPSGISFIKSEYASRTLTWTASPQVPSRVSFGPTDAMETDAGVRDSGVLLSDVGIADAAGTVFWCVTLEADGDAGTRLSLPGPVWSFTIFDKPVFENNGLPGAGGEASVFTKTTLNINASASRATRYAVSYVDVSGKASTGLKGLEIDSNGTISGAPQKAGSYRVTVTAWDVGGRSTTTTFTITVAKLAATKYNGVVIKNGLPAGTMTLNQSATGRATAKLIMNAKTTSLKGTLLSEGNGSLGVRLTANNGAIVNVSLKNNTLTGVIAGEPSTTEVRGQVAKGSGVQAGYYTVALSPNVVQPRGALNYVPDGFGYLTVTVNSSGTARYAGLLPDGTRLSGSTPQFTLLGAHNGLALYQALYSKRGSVALLVPVSNVAFGGVRGTWDYPGKLDRSDAFSALLSGEGAPYVKQGVGLSALTGKTAFATGLTSVSVPVVISGTALTAKGSELQLKGNATTGLLSGKAGKAAVKGVIIQPVGEAVGQYLVPHPTNSRFKQSYPVTIE